MKKIRTYSNEGQELIRKHIREYYTAEELKRDMDAVRWPKSQTDYNALKKVVEGANLEYRNHAIQDFQNGLKAQGVVISEPNTRDDESRWKWYKHIIAQVGEKMVAKV